jgi:hypothetical protein
VTTLRVGEVAHLLDEASRLCGIVVLHRGFEVLAKRDGLTELPS